MYCFTSLEINNYEDEKCRKQPFPVRGGVKSLRTGVGLKILGLGGGGGGVKSKINIMS